MVDRRLFLAGGGAALGLGLWQMRGLAAEALGYDAFVFKNGAQRPIGEFDPQVDHRDAVETPAYIFNFIFKPRR